MRSATVLLNLIRLLKGREPLDAHCPDDEFENPINGILSSMTLHVGYHMRGVIPAVFYREDLSPKETMALVQNNISKLDSSSAAFSELLRRHRRKLLLRSESDSNPQRENDVYLPLEFRAIISQTEEGDVQGMFEKLYIRAQRGAVNTGSVRSRMKNSLLGRVLVTASPLCMTLSNL